MMNPTVRPAAVAGMFYPGGRQILAASVDDMLAAARAQDLPAKAMIVPHAGYIYSGPIAASAYALLRSRAAQIHRVVIFGPAHRVAIAGLAAPSVSAFATPLGAVAVDSDAIAAAARLPQVQINDAAHAQEHSLEVQLPFLQALLGQFAIVPFVVGAASAHQVAEVMELLWGGPETLVLVSSDLSHYHPYGTARQLDQRTVEDILSLSPLADHQQACGATPINGLIEVARRRHLSAKLLDLRNSGDTAGDKTRVVGYSSFAFTEAREPDQKPAAPSAARAPAALDGATGAASPLPQDAASLGAALLIRARNAIAARFGQPPAAEPEHAALINAGATFVTLTQQGQLRGCIGSLEARRKLDTDVRANAQAAAFQDPRFQPLSEAELARTRVEVSLLTPAVPLGFTDEANAVDQLRPGIDGVILQHGNHRATFLPQVWESLPDRRQFMAQLKRKAGLPADFWAEGIKLYRYEVQKWKEVEKS